MSYDLDKIRDAATLPELCKRLDFEVNRQGKISCPFHTEKTPSCSVHERYFKCHGCGEGGDVFSFAQKFCGCGFKEALKWLGDLFGIQPEEGGDGIDALPPIPRGKAAEMPPQELAEVEGRLQQLSCEYLLKNLDSYAGYFDARGWSPKIIAELIAEGSLGGAADGSLWFNGRYGSKRRTDPNSSRSCRYEFGKGKHFIWRQGLNPGPVVYLFEGETDLISAASAIGSLDGFMSVPGASWQPTRRQAIEIGSFRTVHLAFDNDAAGAAATERIAKAFRTIKECDVKQFKWTQSMGAAKDISDLLKEVGAEKFRKLFDQNWVSP